jgi:hypothetical protein
MSTRIEFINGNAVTVVEDYEEVKDDFGNKFDGLIQEYTLRPKDNPGQAQPIMIHFDHVVSVRPAHAERLTPSQTPKSGLGGR